MSGRNMRSFVVNHRADETDKLVQRVKGGLGSQKYKPVDYDQLKALTLEKKIKGQEKLMKVKKLKEVSKHGKEQNLIKQHQMVWKKEFLRLNTMRKRLEAELAMLYQQNSGDEHTDQLFLDFEEYEYGLENDFKQFKSNTTEPIWNLREDLEYYAHQYKQGVRKGMEEEDPESVLATVNNVKQQQRRVMDKLQHEQDALENDLLIGELADLSAPTQEKKIHTGIPAEAFNLECPDIDFKASILQEFLFLDEKYIEKLELVETQHSEAISSSTGGWTEEEHFTYVYALDQYTHDLTNRRTLYIDRMRRHLPHKTRAEIVSHEEWWTYYKYYHERRKDLINDWYRDRKELLNRAKVVFVEMQTAYETKLAKAEFHKMQKELCGDLYHKVKSWREQKMEAMQLEIEILERERQEKLAQLRIEEEKDRKRRQGEKEQLEKYHHKREEQKKEEREAEKARLEDLKKVLAEQAEHDSKRVRFREEQFQYKVEDQIKRKEEEEENRLEKERVLEAIRMQVRPHVEGDLMRLWSDTEAVKAHQKAEEEYVQLQRPLFEVNTFTSKQITADPRVRLEQKLRDAGVVGNAYARQAMAQAQPLREPRRDMNSTVFKNQ